jgi:hypothetical protein
MVAKPAQRITRGDGLSDFIGAKEIATNQAGVVRAKVLGRCHQARRFK